MRNLFLTLALCIPSFTITACIAMAGDDYKESEGIYISNRLEDFAAHVSLGADNSMPIDGDYYFSIQPTVAKTGKIVVPSSIPAVFQEMNHAVPHWYLAVLSRSEGENECSVQVNDIDYTTALESWFWVNWQLGSESSPLREKFVKLGITSQLLILNAISMGFCEFIKEGGSEDAAMAVVVTYGEDN